MSGGIVARGHGRHGRHGRLARRHRRAVPSAVTAQATGPVLAVPGPVPRPGEARVPRRHARTAVPRAGIGAGPAAQISG
ncbi:hypothetical protein ACIGO8_12110 [Streptomyces sp. NPDC053493]|uniref:hypothetical protein n=1 Tax=Streptomyces sp. NPDC053493 TaxID=3365705 RepID=UPI0037D05C7D